MVNEHTLDGSDRSALQAIADMASLATETTDYKQLLALAIAIAQVHVSGKIEVKGEDSVSKADLYRRWVKADEDWHAELVKQFGQNACNARYEARGKGEPGSKLNELATQFETSREDWRKGMSLRRP